MAILNFFRKSQSVKFSAELQTLMQGFSIEVIPRTAEKIDSFTDILPQGTRVYIAHIKGTPIDDMVATAKRIADEGFQVMPHFSARIIADKATFEDWLKRYRDEAGVSQALVLAGGLSEPLGDFHNSMQLLETGLFDAYGFKTLHVAGHPEGNRDIDQDGSTKLVDEAVRWKQAFNERTDAHMAMVTQFAFVAEPVLSWAKGLQAAGVDLPIHIGIAGPTKLQTLIKFSIACGVGPSLSVLKNRALDLSQLLLPFEPTEFLEALAQAHAKGEAGNIEKVHVFPLGGINAAASFADCVQKGYR